MSKKIGTILLLIGLLLLSCGCLLCCQVPDGYQYALPAGNLGETYRQAVPAVKGLDEVAGRATISARKQGIALQGVREEIHITLYAVDANYPSICHETLRAGRFISAGDVENKRHVIIIDENTAYALYTGGEALGKVLVIGGTDWTIVGIIAGRSRYGESNHGVAYVPITAAITLPMDTLEIRLTGSYESGRAALIETSLRQWHRDGTFHDLRREKYAATMPLHWAATTVSLLLTLRIGRRTLKFCVLTFHHYKEKLQMHYIRELLLWLTAKMLLLLLLGLGTACLAVLTLRLFTAPALVFTDWIPENPVSVTSYVQRFWAIHQESAQAVLYLTREESIVMLAAWLIRWGTLATLGGILIQTIKWRNTK